MESENMPTGTIQDALVYLVKSGANFELVDINDVRGLSTCDLMLTVRIPRIEYFNLCARLREKK